MQSQYAKVVPGILEEMGKGREEDDTRANDQDTEEPEKVIYIYSLEGGGVVFTETPIEDDNPAIVDSQEPATDTRPTTRREIPYFLHFLLMLFLFVALDNVDTFFTMLAPTVTVSITPVEKTVSTTTTLTVGETGANVRGRVLAPLTLTQSQTVNATGHGHQDAAQAAGHLTFYNGSFTAKTIVGGTVFTGVDRIQIVTDQTVTIPPGNPPTYGEATVTAHAAHAGSQGNLAPEEINISVSSDVQVKNGAFSGGKDARDYTYVSKADIQGVVSHLTPMLLQSEQAALTTQLKTGESLLSPVCTPHTTTSHNAGDEVASVTVTVSKTCASVAYNALELETAAARIQTTQRAASLTHSQKIGDIQITILSQVLSSSRAALTVQLVSTWVYELNEQRLIALLLGKPRLTALQVLSTVPGVRTVNIAGVNDNEQLPTDPVHIHLLLIVQE